MYIEYLRVDLTLTNLSHIDLFHLNPPLPLLKHIPVVYPVHCFYDSQYRPEDQTPPHVIVILITLTLSTNNLILHYLFVI